MAPTFDYDYKARNDSESEKSSLIFGEADVGIPRLFTPNVMAATRQDKSSKAASSSACVQSKAPRLVMVRHEESSGFLFAWV